MLPTIFLVASVTAKAHWVDWSAPGLVVTQSAIALGIPHKDEHVIFFFPTNNCKDGMKVYAAQYGDEEKAEEFLIDSKFCK